MTATVDVIVIGGGAAGLSGAVALARSRRSVLLPDAGDPRDAPTGHVHNFLTRDGAAPAEIYAAGRAEIARYGGRVESGRARSVDRVGDLFGVDVDGLGTMHARRILVATGAHDELPEIPGLAQRWGTDVLHCPYCHGWEVRDQRIGVLATGPMAVPQALLFRQLSGPVTLLRHSGPTPADEQLEQLDAPGIAVVNGMVEQILVEQVAAGPTVLTGVRLAGGGRLQLDALVVAPRVSARAGLLAPLGLAPVEVRVGDHIIGSRIESDATGATAVPGVWVAGNVTDIQAQAIGSAAAGLLAGAAINADLIGQEAREAGAVLGESRIER